MNITCYDIDGNVIRTLTQWDINQKIVIKNLSLTQTPEVHFCNSDSKLALVSDATFENGDLIVEVPNVLLQEKLSIIMYIYVVRDDGSAKTTYTIRIPVNPRAKPLDYIYSDNSYFISLERLQNAIAESENVIELANAAAIRAEESAVLAEKAMEYSKNNFANVIKGASHSDKDGSVYIDDMSPIEHEIEVLLTQKNLWNTGNITVTNHYTVVNLNDVLKAGKTYTVTADVESTDTDDTTCLLINYTNNNEQLGLIERGEGKTLTFTLKGDCKTLMFYSSTSYPNSADDTATFKNVQLETGAVATKYTPYIDPSTIKLKVYGGAEEITEYTPNADGTVDGVKSCYPNMTLFTDTDGITINCKYNKDINKVVEYLENVPSDWNEVDENSPAYIKNRTHYVGEVFVEDLVLPNQDEFYLVTDKDEDSGMTMGYQLLGYKANFVAGQTYNLKMTLSDGSASITENMPLTAYQSSDLSSELWDDVVVLMNDNTPYIIAGGTITDFSDFSTATKCDDTMYVSAKIDGGTVEIVCEGYNNIAVDVKKLDERYLPNNIVNCEPKTIKSYLKNTDNVYALNPHPVISGGGALSSDFKDFKTTYQTYYVVNTSSNTFQLQPVGSYTAINQTFYVNVPNLSFGNGTHILLDITSPTEWKMKKFSGSYNASMLKKPKGYDTLEFEVSGMCEVTGSYATDIRDIGGISFIKDNGYMAFESNLKHYYFDYENVLKTEANNAGSISVFKALAQDYKCRSWKYCCSGKITFTDNKICYTGEILCVPLNVDTDSPTNHTYPAYYPVYGWLEWADNRTDSLKEIVENNNVALISYDIHGGEILTKWRT